MKNIDITTLIGKEFAGPHGTTVIIKNGLDMGAYLKNGIHEAFSASTVYIDKYGTGRMRTYIGNTITLYVVQPGLMREAQEAGYSVVGVYKTGRDPMEDLPSLVGFARTQPIEDQDDIRMLTNTLSEDIDEAFRKGLGDDAWDMMWASYVPDAEERTTGTYRC